MSFHAYATDQPAEQTAIGLFVDLAGREYRHWRINPEAPAN